MKYHADIYMPFQISFAGKSSPTKHALDKARREKFKLPAYVDSSVGRIIEVATKDGKPIKALQRIPYVGGKDLCLVVALDTLKLVTAWLNNSTDTHETLDRGKYVCPTD